MDGTSRKPGLSRRSLLAGSAAGLTFAFGFAPARHSAVAQGLPEGRLNAYVTIRPDGTVIIQAPAPEMGQATNTTLPLILAEELDADWDKVRIETAPVAPAYDHPVFRSQFVVASLTTRAYWMPIRLAGAQARRVLMLAAAERWNAPLAELSTGPGMVRHAASGRSLGYGEIASFAALPATMPEIKPEELKKPADFRLIGKDVKRWDVPAKSSGQALYAIDVQVPGMVYGVLARAPVMGASPKAHNGAALRQRPGVLAVVELPQGVAVVAEKIEQALAARAALTVEWNAAPGSGFSSEAGLQAYLADTRDAGKAGVIGRKTGEIGTALAGAAKVVTGEYTTDYAYHAQMEPLTCTAAVTAAGVEVWVGTQWPTKARGDAARAAGVPPEAVKVHPLTMGGGFGRRAQLEYVTEAVLVAKAVGRPVKLMPTREDDVANAHCRPMTAHRIEVGLDVAGRITGWKHRIAADLVVPQIYGQERLDAQKGVDHIVMAHADVPLYDIPVHQAEHVYENSGIRTAAWRGIGAGPNAFAIEAMIDDLARAAKADPVAYRLALLKDARGKAALERAAALAEWNRPRGPEIGLGVALSRLGVPQLGESIAVSVVELALDRAAGAIRVQQVWCVADVGLPVQPRNIRQQVEGSLVWGLSSALTERITVKNGAVEQQNFGDYEIMRLSAMPRIAVEVLRSGDIPLPVGELGLATIMPAISNAVMALTGKRLAQAPFTTTRVKAALQG